jgi:hypothetical protein
MRHLWQAPDDVQMAVVQQGVDVGLGLFASFDAGLTWSFQESLVRSSNIVSDGIALDDGSLLLVTSIARNGALAHVDFVRMNYDTEAMSWSVDPLAPSRVFESTASAQGSRATLAMDSNGVLWCALRWLDTSSGNVQIRLFYSEDDGLTWQDSGNVFGTANAWAEKDAKVIATGMGIAVVFQDIQGGARNPVRSKASAWRDDADPPEAAMAIEPIADMVGAADDPYGSHWSVAADSLGNIHMSYQDGQVRYTAYDAVAQSWSAPVALGTQSGTYNSLSVAGNDDVYVFTRFVAGTNLWVKRMDAGTQSWTGWIQVSEDPPPGQLRMCSPERVEEALPVLYQVNGSAPFELLHALLDV